ncbi:hypothetical protein N7471_005780 [Penicillium samsonianum]|uniref:uncharacterized protein n=1 Tax=Penicillium samsonianum TaxID=1882272 RepID=UPI0025477517|nr:uncharacterized protein N7471_005780 [Penicillium samsonianum]KAJ6139294.1 hypothetical protein N7471_005780 [Penicillium samsonianum]
MTDKLPPPLLALFQPRPPLRYLPPGDRAPDDCQKSTISGVAQFLADAKTLADEVPYNATESWVQRKLREKTEKKEQLEKQIADGLQNYNPDKDPQARGDPFRTIFVSRLSYEAKEADLEREFSRFGPIERITIVKDTVSDKKKKPHRGYAFVVFEREKDMKAAYKETENIRIKGRPAVVDVERGRTTKGWKPRRLGGGLGGRGYTKISQAPRGGPGFNAPSGPGGYGGGFRGGFGGRGGGGGGGGGFRGGGFRGGGDRFGGPRGGIGYQGNRGGFGGQAPLTRPPALAVDAAEVSGVVASVVIVVTAVVAPVPDSTVVQLAAIRSLCALEIAMLTVTAATMTAMTVTETVIVTAWETEAWETEMETDSGTGIVSVVTGMAAAAVMVAVMVVVMVVVMAAGRIMDASETVRTNLDTMIPVPGEGTKPSLIPRILTLSDKVWVCWWVSLIYPVSSLFLKGKRVNHELAHVQFSPL